MTSAGAGGFAKGFAQGFVTTFTAAQQRKHETDQLTLKSRLDQLREDAEARKKKQEEESQYLKDGETLAQMVGDPTLAPDIAKLRASGISSDGILDSFRKGNLVPNQTASKEMTIERKNPDLMPKDVSPVSTMNMPAGVIPVDKNALQPIPNYDPSRAPLDGVELSKPLPYDENAEIAKARGMDPADLKASTERADQTIRDAGIVFDVDERKETQAKAEKVLAQSNSRLKFIPDTRQEKFLPLEEAYWKRSEAKRTGNMDDYYKYDSMVKASSYAKSLERVNDPTVHQYAQLDKDGKFLTYFDAQIVEDPDTGEKRVYNMDTQKYQDGNLRYIPKDVFMKTGDIIDKFEGRSEKYNLRRAKFTSSLESSAQMIELVDKFDMPNTVVGRMTAQMKGLVEEARTGLQAFEKEAQKRIEAEDWEGARQQAQALSERAANMLSQGIRNEADAVILFETYKTALIYDLAAAKGETGNGLTAKDIENFRSQLTAKDAPTLKKQIGAALSSVWRGLEAERVGLNMEAGNTVTQHEKILGFSLEYKKERYQNFLQEMYADNPEMLQKTSTLFQSIDKGVLPGPNSVLHDQVQSTEQPQVQTLTRDQAGIDAWNNAPSGTVFIDDKGQKKVKP